MNEIFIYVDEAGNPNIKKYKGGENERYFQVGAAVFSHQVSQETIDNAMAKLKKVDPAILTSSDKKAIERGFFHASFDGPNAKAKLMDEANKYKIEFYHNNYDKQMHSELGREYLTEQQLHFHLIHLCSVIGLNYDVKKINLIVAQRDKSFPLGSEQKWIESFYEELSNSAIQNASIKTPFPELNVTIVNGQDPGVQITDLLLWAMTRKNRTQSPNGDWYDRIKTGTSSKVTIPNDPLSMNDFYVNSHISEQNKEIIYNITPSEIDEFEQKSDTNRFYRIIMWIEDVVVQAFETRQLEYLDVYLQKTVRIIENKQELSFEEIKKICKVFLMIFDTVKYSEILKNDELKFALLAKRYAAIILAGQEIRWFQMSKEWSRVHPKFYEIRNDNKS